MVLQLGDKYRKEWPARVLGKIKGYIAVSNVENLDVSFQKDLPQICSIGRENVLV